jgi:hypothetical protein
VLALRGATVTLTARDLTAGESAAAQIRQSTGNPPVDVRPLELADQASVLFDDLTFAFVAYDPFAAYSQSKTANVRSRSRPTGAGPAMASAPTRSCPGGSPPTSSVTS